MTEEKHDSAAQPAELRVDMEGLLTAIQARTSGEIRDAMEAGPSPRREIDGQFIRSGAELGEAFEIDISDCRACEANR